MRTARDVFRFLLMFWLAAHGKAQPRTDLSPPVRADQVQSGTLLVSTDRPGVFLPAPTLETDVTIRVTGITARASVRQSFFNAGDDCVEGVYVFPLPEGSAVDGLRLRVGQRVLEGEIRERDEAKKVYQQAKADGRKASLLDQERPNLFTASVASIGAHEDVEIEIEYQETLRYDQGTFFLRFPLVVAPRYIPGSSLAASPRVSQEGASAPLVEPELGWSPATDRVPDAHRITPPVLPPDQAGANPVRLRVEISSGTRLRRIESSTHAIRAAAVNETSYAVTMAEETLAADRDFELHWEPNLEQRPRPTLFAASRDGQTYALLVVLPPEETSVKQVRLPRETIFVVDTSGSMYGASIDQARRSLLFALDGMRPEDRFNIIEFNSATRRLYDESRRALPDAIAEARQWVGRLHANGGTEMLPALSAALEGAQEGEQVRQVVFITDGAVGNEAELFQYIREHLGRSRLFTVGIGSAPNSHFMTKAAEFGRGTFTYVGSREEVEEKIGGLFRKLESPILTDVRVEWDDPSADSWPAKIPDLYAGEPLVVAARLSSASGGATVSGQRAGERWTERVALEIAGPDRGIDRLWAGRKIASLMDRITEGAERESVRREVVDVAVRHHLVTSFTSLVAVDRTPTLVGGAICAARAIPVSLPAGWDYGHVFGEIPQTATPGLLYLVLGACAAAASLVLRALSAGGRG